MSRPGPVVVVGGGIAGLTAALDLADGGAPVTVVEAGDRLGGKIFTHRVDGLVVEAGADSFLSSKPAGLALCERLGITDRLVNSKEEDRRTFVWSRGRLRELPEGLVLGSPARAWSLLHSGLLSPVGTARLVADVAVPRRRTGQEDGRGDREAAEETVAGFFTRRLGGEAYSRVVEPLLAGIHAGDATRLSLPATFPRFVDMERD
ncbi:MAG TPA: protoporphyrinogen oxidase, partial [Acidimicrobiia bacterium]|nr:protoporphyrinogen oxidase [Acidimicrobiia bacterium]